MVCMNKCLTLASLMGNGQIPQVCIIVFCSFVICTAIYGSFAIIGYLMFGDKTLSQITLNLPKESFASKVALWTTVTIMLNFILVPGTVTVFP